jgi:L-fuconolactonase
MRIDAHQHFWQYQPARDTWITDEMAVLKKNFLPDRLLPELLANGIQGSIAVQADQSEAETLYLLDLAGPYNWIQGVVGWVDLRAANIAERLTNLSTHPKLCGFRHILQAEPDDFMSRPDFLRGIACLEEFGFVYDILVYARQLPVVSKLVEKFPKQRFVIDHIAKPAIKKKDYRSWAQDLRAIAVNPNVYCKVSGRTSSHIWIWRLRHLEPTG